MRAIPGFCSAGYEFAFAKQADSFYLNVGTHYFSILVIIFGSGWQLLYHYVSSPTIISPAWYPKIPTFKIVSKFVALLYRGMVNVLKP